VTQIPGRDDELLPPDWSELAPLLDLVLDTAPEQRPGLIVALSGGDPVRQKALEQLAADCERESPLLDAAAADRFAGLAPEEPDSLLPELLGDRYRVGRELGRGGMARVYLARDLKHNRDVAIKVIRPELSASLGHDRFLREIGIAARLRHPNIVPLYDSGEVGESLYFVMPYEEGPSLRERLAEGGAVPLSDALSVMRDVARALNYAHEHRVVHRDIKPDNVMLSGGAAVVTDFGIAKAVSAALTDVSGPTLTQSGSAIGTPAYMAPEQATGDPATDHRADLYSFGCLAYELFTGKPPFASESMHLVIAAHLATVPEPVTLHRAEVPAGVAELIARCLEKSPTARPQSARELLDSLEGAATAGYATPSPAAPAAPRPAARALRWAGLGLTVAVVVAGVYFGTRGSASAAPITLSLLPFGNIGADSAISYVAEGLPDQVANELMRVPGIQIQSRNGARYYRGQLVVDVTEAGTRLGADYLVTGVVRQQGGDWILSVSLERAADKASLWGESFTFTEEGSAGAASAIAERLTAELRNRFPNSIGSARVLAQNARTSNSEAYRLYLRAQKQLDARGRSVRQSAELFREAIRLDPLFAPAHAGLSMALALFPYFQSVPVDSVSEEILASARRAIQLDSSLAQPHVALGTLHRFRSDWENTESEFRTAIRLAPRPVEARVQYARDLLFVGRHREGMVQLREAKAIDPASALVLSWMSYGYFVQGQMDSAIVESARAQENDPENLSTVGFRARLLLGAGKNEEARLLADRVPFWDQLYILAKSGDLAGAREGLAALDAQSPQPWLAELRRTHAYLGLGDTARALSALERAIAAKEIWVALYGPSDPLYDGVRESPRFQAVIRQLGLAR
jgi:serine/threonine-protein kinase